MVFGPSFNILSLAVTSLVSTVRNVVAERLSTASNKLV